MYLLSVILAHNQPPRSTQPSISPWWVNWVLPWTAGVKVGGIHLYQVAGNTVWSHMAGYAL